MNQASRGRSSHRSRPVQQERAVWQHSLGRLYIPRITFLSVLPPFPSFHLSLPHSFLLQRHCSRPNCLHGPESLKVTLFHGTDSPWRQEAVYYCIVLGCKSKSKMKKQDRGCEQKSPGRACLPPPCLLQPAVRHGTQEKTISRSPILNTPEALTQRRAGGSGGERDLVPWPAGGSSADRSF